MSADPHQLALNGATEKLMPLIDAGTVSVSSVKQGGMFGGQTLLHCTASRGHTTCAQGLLQRGAAAGTRNAKGKTAAQVAADKGHHALAALLQSASESAPRPAAPVSSGRPQARSAPGASARPSVARYDNDGFVVSDEGAGGGRPEPRPAVPHWQQRQAQAWGVHPVKGAAAGAASSMDADPYFVQSAPVPPPPQQQQQHRACLTQNRRHGGHS